MSSSTNRILVPIDFSEQSLIALEQSYNLSRLTNAELHLLHVIDESFHLPFLGGNEDKTMEVKVTKAMEKLADETRQKAGIKVKVKIASGKIYEEIQNMAKEIETTFIIMGTSGSVGLKRFIGSNALRVIRESPCPVITIKGQKHRSGCKEIILPLDLQKETKEKVTKAIELSKLFGSTIHLITVLQNDDEFIVNKLTRQLEQVKEFVEEHAIPCVSEFIHGDDVAEEVIKYSVKVKADLIMIMTQQEMDWTDMFISPAAQTIINESEIPVLSIRPKERKDTTVSVFQY
jgi:nucleotide-binding universal stress UspA family protein